MVDGQQGSDTVMGGVGDDHVMRGSGDGLTHGGPDFDVCVPLGPGCETMPEP